MKERDRGILKAVKWTGSNIYEISNFARVHVTCCNKCENGNLRIYMRLGVITVRKNDYLVKSRDRIFTCSEEEYSKMQEDNYEFQRSF